VFLRERQESCGRENPQKFSHLLLSLLRTLLSLNKISHSSEFHNQLHPFKVSVRATRVHGFPQAHLSEFRGTLQADAYLGYEEIYKGGQVQEAVCMAHVRRPFFDLYEAHKSAVAKEALERIAALYAIEDAIRGRSAEERRAVRNERSMPLLESLKTWFDETLGKLSKKSDTTRAIHYALDRWEAVTRYCDDGRLEIDNNAAERSLRGVVLGRKNYCFVDRMPGANAQRRSTVSSGQQNSTV
jgi:hypothetical protein